MDNQDLIDRLNREDYWEILRIFQEVLKAQSGTDDDSYVFDYPDLFVLRHVLGKMLN